LQTSVRHELIDDLPYMADIGSDPFNPSGTNFVLPISFFFWKYRSLDMPVFITPSDPIPRYCL